MTVHRSLFSLLGSCSGSVLCSGSVFLVLGSLAVAACAGDASPGSGSSHAIVERARVSMGSEVRLSAWTDDEDRALKAFERVFDEFDRLDRLLSVWQPHSDVLHLNAAAGRAPLKVQVETLEVLQVAQRVSGWTGGKFDVTFGALSGLWKFDHDQDNRIPGESEIRARLPLVGYEGLVLDAGAGTAFLRQPGMRVHLGGIGKGYAVDRAAAILRAGRVNDFLIQAGGDMYAAGRRGDRAWRAGIRDPRGPADRVFAAMNLRDETFSTSGDYERFFMRDGRRYHHILDPDEGQPARLCRSVTIVAKQAVLADALSTGVFVAGPQAGMTLIEKLPDVEGVIVTADNAVLVSSGLTARLERLLSPTDAP
jgi:thiamine biosynthesis lipoprotein